MIVAALVQSISPGLSVSTSPPRSKYIPNVHSTFLATASAHDRLHSTFLSIRGMYRPGPIEGSSHDKRSRALSRVRGSKLYW